MLNGCSGCSKDSQRLHYDIKDGCWYCSDCYQAPPSRVNYKVTETLSNGAVIGAGHKEDIRHRRVDPSGNVYRDYGRRYI